MNNGKKVKYDEAPSIKAGRFILSKGFKIASMDGDELGAEIEDRNSFGILYMDPDAKPIKELFGLIKHKPPLDFLGTMWFNSKELEANKKNWVVEMSGRKHTGLVKQLAEELLIAFDVNISCYLTSEKVSNNFQF